jgi:tetratricopeptide (TPR) repeat protein
LWDAEAALDLDADFGYALELKASVLSERLGRPAEAIATLNDLLTKYPEEVRQRAGRAVLLARAGRDDAALADARQVVAAADREGDALALYQVAGAYALLSQRDGRHRATALALLAKALRLDPALIRVTFYDPELRPFDSDPEFARLRDAAALLARPKP